MRGYSAIGVDSPKNAINIGGILRAAGNYGCRLVVLGNPRCNVRHPADTQKVYRHTPVVRVADVFEAIPFDAVPIAVDLIEGGCPLPQYQHPERAFYIFGAEDRTLGKRITDRCAHKVYIPTHLCMNLATTVAVVLYDRLVKRREWMDGMTALRETA